jgi:hypothetical protein
LENSRYCDFKRNMTVHSTAPVNKRCFTHLRTYLSVTSENSYYYIQIHTIFFFQLCAFVIIGYKFVINIRFTKTVSDFFLCIISRSTSSPTSLQFLYFSLHFLYHQFFPSPHYPPVKVHQNTRIRRHRLSLSLSLSLFLDADSMSKPNDGCILHLVTKFYNKMSGEFLFQFCVSQIYSNSAGRNFFSRKHGDCPRPSVQYAVICSLCKILGNPMEGVCSTR